MPACIERLINPCPPAGTGIHAWLFYAANRLHDAGESPENAVAYLATAVTASDPRRVDMAELRRTVRNVWQRPVEGASASRWPRPLASKPKPRPIWERIAEIVKGGPRMADLWEASPIRCDEDMPNAEGFIDILFPESPLLCVARQNPADAVTLPRALWRGKLASSALIVPSPMIATWGLTKDGRRSARCLANTGPRQYLVVEFDFKRTPPDKLAKLSGDALEGARTVNVMLDTGLPSQELCAALGWHLATAHKGRLAVVVSSGGKSLHFWFDVHGVDETTLQVWFAAARRLGADPATNVPCQLVRLPEGTRGNGARQSVIYFNPREIGGAR